MTGSQQPSDVRFVVQRGDSSVDADLELIHGLTSQDIIDAVADARYGTYVSPTPTATRTIDGLANVLGWWDAGDLTGANGSAVAVLPDKSGCGQDLINAASATQPTVTTNSLNGKPTMALGASSFLARSLFGNNWGQPAGFAQPITIMGLVRIASAGSRAAAGALTGWNSPAGTNRISLQVDTTGTPNLFGSAAGAVGGAPINDDQWHAWAGVFDTTSSSLYIDGTLVAALATAAHGTNVLGGFAIGAAVDGSSPVGLADVAEMVVCQSRLTPRLIAKYAAALASKWGF